MQDSQAKKQPNAKTRQPLSFDGRWMTMARSKAGEVISVTYYTRMYANKRLPSPLPSYTNAEGRNRSMNDLEFDTISSEIFERAGRDGLMTINLTATAFKIWEEHGLELLSRDDVKKLDDDEAPSASKADSSKRAYRKRKRGTPETPDVPATDKRRRFSVASAGTQTEGVAALFVSRGTQTESPVVEQRDADILELEPDYNEDDSAWETESEDYQDEDISTISNNATTDNDTIDNEAGWESDIGVNEEGGHDSDGEAHGDADGEVGNNDGLVTVKLPSGRERRVSKMDAILLAWVNA